MDTNRRIVSMCDYGWNMEPLLQSGRNLLSKETEIIARIVSSKEQWEHKKYCVDV